MCLPSGFLLSRQLLPCSPSIGGKTYLKASTNLAFHTKAISRLTLIQFAKRKLSMDEDWCSHCSEIVKTKLYNEPDRAWWDCSLCGKILGDRSTRRTKEQLSKLRKERLRRTILARKVQRLVQQSQTEREAATQSTQSS